MKELAVQLSAFGEGKRGRVGVRSGVCGDGRREGRVKWVVSFSSFFFSSFPPLFLPCLLLLAETRVLPFYILHLIWRCSLFPLIDLLEAAKLSSVALLACSSFLHFLYKEMERGGKRSRTLLRQHYLKGAQCVARK